ncbi:hypothetical protein AVEN_54854-1 [Araneus ventricosus]|uniref:Uncharacterized protein n=1 Tax=Araneus ventricosus TaxID=182803 RepID=A0A4Y2IAJ3_ARAVE|nr:hypothetical protein AVEN_54854-1 [Araneus ventricosus]
MVIEAFVSSVNQFIETGIEETRFQVTSPFDDGFLNFGDLQHAYSMVRRDKSNLVRDPGYREMFQCLCGGRARQFCTLVFVKGNRVSTS